jgi:Protein kinase domain
MSERYEAFCMAHPLFYDALHSESTAGKSFATADRPLPDGWRRAEQDDWLVFGPPDLNVPAQGWKIHVSATLANADRVLDTIWDYCVARAIEFKFLRSEAALWLRSSKYAPRGFSGKLVTIYPRDDAECATILGELGRLLDGEPGPYILSDLRWGDGPLHVRYGGFAPQHCVDEAGQVVLAIADNTGRLVPDRREPVFRVPPWLTLPDFLAPAMARRNAVTVADIPYRVESAMHFSNGGGIYRAVAKSDGRAAVLKEARPHAGLDGAGADAVARVAREFEILQRLSGIPAVPRAYEMFTLGDHHFLAMEYVEGRPLHKVLVRRYPLIDVGAGPEDFASYVTWALDIYRQVEAALLAMHERGVVYGDLHLFNVLVREDDSVALLDYEVASYVEENRRPALGNQGFAAPNTTTGVDVDRYALACLRLALFLPVTQILWLARSKVVHLAEVIREYFPVPPGFLADAVDVILAAERKRLSAAVEPAAVEPAAVEPVRGAPAAVGPGRGGSVGPAPEPDSESGLDPDDWPGTRRRLAEAILSTATPDRQDRLFPGDIEQFRLGGLGLAYGAAGVLYSLAVTGAGRYPAHEEWLLRQAKQPPPGTMMGLYDGLHGVAFTLDHLGYRAEALDALDMCLGDGWADLGLDLIGGLSGIGLNLAHFADRTGDAALWSAARRAADLVAERLGDVASVAETSSLEHPYAGLFRGSSGPALLLLRMYDDTGDPGYLERAAVALRQDLRRCRLRDNGVMEVNEGWRTMPYLAVGSVGVGVALDEYLAHRADEQFANAATAIRRAALSRLYVQSGLFSGRAGMVLYLAGQAAGNSGSAGNSGDDGNSGSAAADPDVLDQLRRLSWHALPLAGGLAFPGDQLLRLSMDLATGTAGVLLAIGAARHEQPVHLPLLPRAGRRAPQTPAPLGRGSVGEPAR